MNTAMKLGAFGLSLGLVFGATYWVGEVAGPDPAAAPPPAVAHEATGEHDATGEPGDDTGASDRPGGLLVSEQGYTFTRVAAPDGELAFRITGPDGEPVTAYDVAHDKRMHLIAARRDLSGFRHVHPELDPDGTWRVDSPLAGPGTWRLFADFTPTGGPALTLGLDVQVAGEFTPEPLPEPAATATVDGYTVRLAGGLEPGGTSELTLTVTRDGEPVTDLEPYLGAYGHLVALREGDLAYLHVHPDGEPGDGRTRPGPEVTFFAEVPSAGAYRLFLDFQHDGVVRTAEFTVRTAGPVPVPAAEDSDHPEPAGEPDHDEPGHGHD